MGKDFSKKMHPFNAGHGISVSNIDRPLGCHQFIRRHAGVAHQYQAGFRIQAGKFFQRFGFLAPGGVLPQHIIYGIMEVVGFYIFKLGPGVIKERLHNPYIGIHGPAAIVDRQNDFQTVP